MMIFAYLKESNANELLKIELSAANQITTNGGIIQTTFVSESHTNPPPDVVMHCTKTSAPPATFFDEIVECFSVRKNFLTLIDTKKPTNAVPIVDGLK